MSATMAVRQTARSACLAAVAVLMCAGCSGQSSTESFSPDTQPPRIVSLNPCLDAMLIEIAEPEQILALSHYSRDPSSSSIEADVAERFAITGGTAEEIIALGPDMVVASTFIAPSTKAALERLGLRVETFGNPRTLDESLAQIERLAQLARRDRQGRALATRIMRASPIFMTRAGPVEDGIDTLLWQAGQIVPGEASLVWEHLARFGFANHAAELGLGQADHVSLERVLADPPDLLLVAGNSAGQTHPLLEELDETRVAQFDPKLFYCGGPSIPKAWKRLEEIQLDYVLNPPGSAPGHDHDHGHQHGSQHGHHYGHDSGFDDDDHDHDHDHDHEHDHDHAH